jgi:putative hydrolase of the HAD superfamily
VIKVIVFDIGNVLAPFVWEDCLREHGFSEDMIRRIGKATVNSELWKELDRSALMEDELIERFVAQAPEIASEIRQFLQISDTAVREFDYSAGLIDRLKENGYKVYLLSNYGGRNFQYALNHFEFIRHADGGVISYEVGYVKPEPGIFRALIEKYGFDPGEALFLDDVRTNIEAAAEQGFHTVHFTGLLEALEEMRSLQIHI